MNSQLFNIGIKLDRVDVSVLPAYILDTLFKFLSLLSLVFIFILFLIVCTSVYLCVWICV